ncbi:hypothetical protein K6U06_09410 [Acidiferrimicrobium sp. IK]|uniref:hypothetical protein n=1 Tax=Acidiferrimicrobium sp. IK TaxID=2871700 RepID=UPI0021CB0F45|nr:hypothetical protein [Acidiferrimicrobium sp. IK]MCU4184577.1 hypothetical protein [Acidiferrimicrobium sp. IK]
MAEDRPNDERPDEGARSAPEPDAPGAAADDDLSTALPPKIERWRKRSAAGAIMTGFALGLQQVFEPEKKEPSIMLETSGDPPGDLPVDAELDGLGARHSVVRIRPWLLEGNRSAAAAATDDPDGPASGSSEATDADPDRGRQS